MRYYYYPSTYRGIIGKGFGGSYAGGRGSNCGYLVGCGYEGGRLKVKRVKRIKKHKVRPKLNFVEKNYG